MRILDAAARYFLIGLALGFGLGAVRTVVLEPWVGPTLASLMELPVMLALLWPGCRWALRGARLPDQSGARAATGALWFVLFMAAEVALGALLRGWTPARTLAHFGTLPGLLGLGGFVAAALLPLGVPLGAPRRAAAG